jgi:hypothetical protein
MLFNHPTFYDHMVIIHALGSPLRFAVLAKRVRAWPLRALARSMGCVMLTPGSGFSALAEAVADPTSNGTIAIAPAGGAAEHPQWSLRPFRSGAFSLGLPRLSAAVLSYAPYEPWADGQPLLSAVWSRVTGPPVRCRVSVARLGGVTAEGARTAMMNARARPDLTQ